MKNPHLVILAAGMGSRYGGLKQIDKVDDFGHIIIDYSIYDAMRAGFRDFVFIIKKEIEKDFREVMDAHLAGKDINVSYVFQELYKLPEGFEVPDGRKKPWGTAHALACCEGTVEAPFAVINADDYYGENAFVEIYDFLKNSEASEKLHLAMVGYRVGNTVTDKGAVTRGVCAVSDGYLTEVIETSGIAISGDRIYYTDGESQVDLPADTVVSMNLWGFTSEFISECKTRFAAFLGENIDKNPEKCEFYIPTVVSQLISEGKADVKVIETNDKWHGVTYKEDKPDVVAAFKRLIAEGKYPENF
ncbi:MAG: nucleotidyltransferase [Clostridia bacterium]|nr:nucleotidyltransferase [Clostridia bacterium]